MSLPIGPIDHVAIAVADLDAACERYSTLLGGRILHREVVEGQPVEVAFVEVPGTTLIELVAATEPGTPLAKFVERRGEGLHHVCFRVEDLEAALEKARSDGYELIDQSGRPGAAGSRIGFLHPHNPTITWD